MTRFCFNQAQRASYARRYHSERCFVSETDQVGFQRSAKDFLAHSEL
jgi:hypothetical protein